MTQAAAVAMFDSKWWESETPADIVEFQIDEERLCMPFGLFKDAVETVLGRPVWCHEFAEPQGLRAELWRKRKGVA